MRNSWLPRGVNEIGGRSRFAPITLNVRAHECRSMCHSRWRGAQTEVTLRKLGEINTMRWNWKTVASLVVVISLMAGGWFYFILTQNKLQFEEMIKRNVKNVPRRIDADILLESVRPDAGRTIVFEYRLDQLSVEKIDVEVLRQAVKNDVCAEPGKFRKLDIKHRHVFVDKYRAPVLTVSLDAQSCAI